MSENEHQHENCHDLLASLGDYVDGSLRGDLCAEIEKHLAGCPRCQVVVDTTRRTVELYHETAGEADLPPQVRQRLFACLHLDEFVEKK